jgi:NitT/TauT family transport system substrate-binding protein
MSEDQWYPNQQIAAVVLGGDFMKKRPELAHKFMRRYLRGVRYYVSSLKGGKVAGRDASAVLEILTDVMHPKDASLYTRTMALYVNPDAALDKLSMQHDFEYFRAQSLLAKPGMSINDVVDGSWLSRALRDVGPYKPART